MAAISPNAADDKSPGFRALTELTEDRTAIVNIGLKGYFVDALRRLPEDKWASINLLNLPKQLDWLHSDAATVSIGAQSEAEEKPQVLFYPASLALADTTIQQFSDGVWWLPSFQDGDVVDLGRGLEGYRIHSPVSGTSFVVWSTDGSTRNVVFNLTKGALPLVSTADGQVFRIGKKGNAVTIPISTIPTVITGIASLPLPNGAVQSELAEADRLIGVGTGSHQPMEVYSQRLYYIRNNVMVGANQSSSGVYDMVHYLVRQLTSVLKPYVWVEGEATSSQTFNSIVSAPDVSGGAYLWLDEDNAAPSSSSGGYHADFAFDLPAQDTYTIWASLAPGVPGVGQSSPITYSVDGKTPYDVVDPETSGTAYGTVIQAGTATRTGQFTWCKLGSADLSSGAHTLSITVIGPAPSTGRYTLGIDCFCITRGNMRPDGARQPTID